MTFKSISLLLGLAAAAALGASGAALAHGSGSYGGGYGGGPSGWHHGWHMGPGMMGPGMGYGMGPGMMGRWGGYGMGPGMGYGMGPGMGPGMMQPLRRDLSVADVKHMMEHRLAWRGDDDLKLGKVEAKNDDTIVAEIVDRDGDVVQTVEVNRHTGWMQRVR